MEKIVKSKRKSNKEKGITLVALVITIIIIIILATVTINFLFGQNGLITRAQQAKLQHEIETARETLTMVLADAFTEKKINPDYDQNEFLDDFIKAREPNVYLEEKAIGLDGYVFGLDRSVPELGEYQGELEGPRIQEIKVTNETTNSASIEVIATNNENATYEYWYKNDSEGEDQWKKIETDENSNTCTISGLTQGEIYNIRVVITTNEGSTEGTINVHLGEMPEGAVQFTPVQWIGDGTATTTINTSETGYTLQYQVVAGDKEPESTAWEPATPGQTIDNLHHNETVYGRLFDGTNESKVYATVKVTDGEPPEVSVNTSNVTTNGATLEVTASDGQSGLADTNTYQYFVDEESTPRETSTSNSYDYTGLTQGIDHILKVIVTDRAGNTTEKTTTITTTSLPGGQDAVEQGLITFTTPTWSGGKASVTVSTSTNNTIQYQVAAGEGAIVDGNWEPLPANGVVGNLNHNDTVYARLTDGTNYGDDASTTVKDETPPQEATISLSSTSVTTGASVTATVTHRDNESGPNISACKYIWNTSSTKLGTDASKYTGGTFSSNGQQISRTMSSTGTYYLHVLTVDKAGNATEKVSSGITVQAPSISETASYVGYYADVDGNGSVDGIIYADLAQPKSGQWNDSNGTYSYTNPGNLKKYKVEGTYSGDFGSQGVVKPNGGSGNERFYVMALSDVDSSYHHWWYDAYKNMGDYSSTTSVNFGSGEQNTINMRSKWNSNAYGFKNTGDYTDMWGLSAVQSGTWNDSTGWYVPSRGEWAAFGDNLGITQSNYTKFGLSRIYWSSSQCNTYLAWFVYFDDDCMSTIFNVRSDNYVRLGTTF